MNTKGHGRHTTRIRGALAAFVVLAVVAAGTGCSAGGDAEGEAAPTFRRAEGDALAFDEPVSTASDLIAPASEDGPWTIVGSVLDPEDGAATAAVWTSEDAVEWERSGVDPHRRGAGESMAAAVPTDDGLLAVGRAGDGDESDAAVWRQDGDEWVQARPGVPVAPTVRGRRVGLACTEILRSVCPLRSQSTVDSRRSRDGPYNRGVMSAGTRPPGEGRRTRVAGCVGTARRHAGTPRHAGGVGPHAG